MRFRGLTINSLQAITLITTGLIGSGCAIPTSIPAADRHAAITRWSHCIDNSTAAYTGHPGSMVDQVSGHCEGHKRDVIATFPAHLEKRLDRVLTDRTRTRTASRMIETTFGEQRLPRVQSLIEARHGEL